MMKKVLTVVRTGVREVVLNPVAGIAMAVAQTNVMAVAVHVNTVLGIKFIPGGCVNCDAYQCKRCIWLNRKTTCEVNTPSHEQCVVAHLERNASRVLLNNIRKHESFLPEKEEIKEIDYLDPFEIREQW